MSTFEVSVYMAMVGLIILIAGVWGLVSTITDIVRHRRELRERVGRDG